MPFGEYELSPGLIGLSLLHSAHPEAFQRLLVRASITCYRDFTLAKCRSPGFASAHADSTPYSGSLSLRMRASSRLSSPAKATRRLIMQKARRHAHKARSDRLRAHGFRICFNLLGGVLFTFPSRYWYAIGLAGVFSLAGWSRRIQAGLHVSRPTQDAARGTKASATGLSPSAAPLSRRPRLAFVPPQARSYNPGGARRRPRFGLLPFRSPLLGESLDYFLFLRVLRCFSSPRSPPRQKNGDTGKAGGLSHSETRGSKATCAYPRIIAACHVLHRLREPRHPPCALELLPRHPPKGGRRSTCVLACADCQRSIAETTAGRERAAARPLPPEGSHMDRKGRPLQKGGVPAAPSGTATLLRLSPNHRYRPRPTLAVTDFRRPRLSWLDGRCVQGPGTYSPRHG